MKKRIQLKLSEKDAVGLIGKALSSPIRLDLLATLASSPRNISELAELYHLPLSSAALHVKVLEQAGLIYITEKPGVRGSQKLCSIHFEDIYFAPNFPEKTAAKMRKVRMSMPIGQYFDCQVTAPCGIVTDQKYIDVEDMQYGFYSPERMGAQMLWFAYGYLEYRFPLNQLTRENLQELKFTFEICSEAPGYRMDWPSDITVWLNQKVVATLYSAGDYGDRRGAQNPNWWPNGSSQYGELRTVTVNHKECLADSIPCSSETLSSLGLWDSNFISLKIGVKPDAEHRGGLNLFGEAFGDYRQNIVMSALVKTTEE